MGARLLLACAALGGACLPEPEPGPAGPFLPFDCKWPWTLPLTALATQVDSLEIGVVEDFSLGGPAALAGTPCSGAERLEACHTRRRTLVEAIPTLTSCVEDCPNRPYVLTTRGDEVSLIEPTPAALHALLGDIDSPEQAAFVLAANNTPLRCGVMLSDPAYRLVPEGIEVRRLRVIDACPYAQVYTFDLVTRSAEVRELDWTPASFVPCAL